MTIDYSIFYVIPIPAMWDFFPVLCVPLQLLYVFGALLSGDTEELRYTSEKILEVNVQVVRLAAVQCSTVQ